MYALRRFTNEGECKKRIPILMFETGVNVMMFLQEMLN